MQRRMYDRAVRVKDAAAVFLVVAACGASAPTGTTPPEPPSTAVRLEMPIEEWGRITSQVPPAPSPPDPSTMTAHITGTVTDTHTGASLPGVTVVATSATLRLTQSAITDEHGHYQINVTPAAYKVSFFFADITHETSTVVSDGSTIVDDRIDQTAAGTEVIRVQGAAPSIVPLSATP
jgi:hypothetical protein